MASTHRTILIIDDDPDARAALRTLLTDADFVVIEATDGRSAVHYLTSNMPEPALIITDLAMADMTGWEFINVLQSYRRLASLPLLVVSGMRLHEVPFRDEGVLEFFPKPVDTKRLVAAAQYHAVTREQREERRHAAIRREALSPF